MSAWTGVMLFGIFILALDTVFSRDTIRYWRARYASVDAARDRWESRALAAQSDARERADDAAEAKRILRRRLRGVLYEARRWKAEAIDRGWTREEHLRDRRAAKALRRHAPAEALAILSEPSAITRIEVPALSPEDRAALAALDCGGLLDAKGSE